MDDLATKIIPLVQMLIPGFVSTMIFYWLADVKKPGQFERTIQALIGTAVITLLVGAIERLLKYVGEHCCVLAQWSQQAESAWGVGLAVCLGLGLAYASNNDYLYSLARRMGLTSRASYPEWIYAFRDRAGKHVVLTLLDGRRLFGYPAVWPTDPKEGHFLITHPSWINDAGEWVDMPGIESYMLNNADVMMVEFLE